jgi:hypothetical protein
MKSYEYIVYAVCISNFLLDTLSLLNVSFTNTNVFHVILNEIPEFHELNFIRVGNVTVSAILPVTSLPI